MTNTDGDRRLSGAEGRNLLLRAAVESALESESADFTVRDVAARAGLNHGLVHRYFSTKDLLVAAVIDDLVASVAATLNDVCDASAPLLDNRGRTLALLLARRRLSESPDHSVMSGLGPIEKALSTGRPPDSDATFKPGRIAGALKLATTLGWSVNEPYLIEACGLSSSDVESVRDQLGDAS